MIKTRSRPPRPRHHVARLRGAMIKTRSWPLGRLTRLDQLPCSRPPSPAGEQTYDRRQCQFLIRSQKNGRRRKSGTVQQWVNSFPHAATSDSSESPSASSLACCSPSYEVNPFLCVAPMPVRTFCECCVRSSMSWKPSTSRVHSALQFRPH